MCNSPFPTKKIVGSLSVPESLIRPDAAQVPVNVLISIVLLNVTGCGAVAADRTASQKTRVLTKVNFRMKMTSFRPL
jgi:hypothetical protein